MRAHGAWRRYQLNKHAAQAVASGHPWIFRGQLSSAAHVFADGQKLWLVDGANRPVGHGFYEAEGAIGVRVLSRRERPPTAAWVREQVTAALERRAGLRAETDAFRAVHGENDRLPGVAIDVYADTLVLQTYSVGADPFGRIAAAAVGRALGLRGGLWRSPTRRRGDRLAAPRRLFGQPSAVVRVKEGALSHAVDLAAGQKTGAFLDLRGLRRHVAALDLTGRRVLNLFAYTATLGTAAEHAGAAEIWNVDTSESALAFGRDHNVNHPERHRFVAADVFAWRPPAEERFDLVIVDPPAMTSRRDDVGRALAAYTRLYRWVRDHVAAGGSLVACCCTSRISAEAFRSCVDAALGPGFALATRIAAEPDHPATFREANYLKLLVYRRADATAASTSSRKIER